jgi:hypothetical protein
VVEVGSTPAAAGLGQLLQLLAIFTPAIFTAAVAAGPWLHPRSSQLP